MSRNRPFNHSPSTPDSIAYLFFSPMIQELEGKVLTFIDAFIQDPVQRKAVKDLARPMIWSWAMESNLSQSYDISMREDMKGQIAKAL